MMKENAMRNILLAGAVALALMMGACMLFDEPANNAIEYDDEGRQLVTLKIFTGEPPRNGRNMSEAMASAAINYFEVLFYKNDDGPTPATPSSGITATALASEQAERNVYIRVGGPRGRVLTVKLTDGTNITGIGRAMVFGGYWDKATDQRSLLAVGIVDGMNTDQTVKQLTGPYVIGPTTVSVHFGLNAVMTRFDSQTNSDFIVSSRASTESPAFENMLVNEKYTPVWRLQKGPFGTIKGVAFTGTDATPATATFRYRIGGTGAVGAAATYHGGIYTQSVSKFDSWAVLNEDDVDAGLVILEVVPTDASLLAGGPLPDPINLNISVGNVPSTNGYALFFPNLVVQMMAPLRITDKWALRNGLTFYLPTDNHQLVLTSGAAIADPKDQGGHSMGGGILLQIGESSAAGGRSIRIIIDGPPPPTMTP